MCDTLAAVGATGTVFAKNSDRPPDEPQVVEAHPRRPGGGRLRTQYLEIADTGSHALIGSRPVWLWGCEHGVNEHGVAIGNEAVYTTGHAGQEPAALIGMDLVRLGLEHGDTAEGAVEAMTALLERHGQGGRCYEHGGSYDSSFLVADPHEVWVLETSGRTWAAKRQDAAAISNRITLRDDWDRASVDEGTDFDSFRDTAVGTGFADVRLGASRACLAAGLEEGSDAVAHLRDHGEGPWGRPGEVSWSPLPPEGFEDESFSVCMHVRGGSNTTAAMVCELSSSVRAWVALGSPCASVFVPVHLPDGVPAELERPEVWQRFAALRDRVEAGDVELGAVREVLAPVEAELWDGEPTWAPVEEALRRLGA